jgi:ketosteroid isomerase-like protein
VSLSRDEWIELIEERYFGSLTRGDIASALACFAPDAVVTVRHGDSLPRTFRNDGEGADALRRFFEHLLANYEPSFTDFVHYVDADNERCASRFTVRLTVRPGSAAAAAGDQELKNCNFFDLEDGRISEMLIYYTNPGSAGDGGSRPTGYPSA